MGKEMSKILPGVFVGRLDNAQNDIDMMTNCITHVLSVHEPVKQKLTKWNSYTYFEVNVEDDDSAPISKYFSKTNYFIHEARVTNGNVLIHCLAGVSRAPTVVLAYLMTVYDLSLQDAFNCVRCIRPNIKPNNGFLRQLTEYEEFDKDAERERLFTKFGVWKDIEEDKKHITDLISQYEDQEIDSPYFKDSTEFFQNDSHESPFLLSYGSDLFFDINSQDSFDKTKRSFDFDTDDIDDEGLEEAYVPGSITIGGTQSDPINVFGSCTSDFRGRAHSRSMGTTLTNDSHGAQKPYDNTTSTSGAPIVDNVDK